MLRGMISLRLRTLLLSLLLGWIGPAGGGSAAEPETSADADAAKPGRPQPLWEVKLPAPAADRVRPLDGGQHLLVAMEGRLERRSADDGSVVWSRPLPPGAFVSLAREATRGGGAAIAWSWSRNGGGALEVARANDGATRFRADLPEPPSGPALPPANASEPWLVPLHQRVAVVDREGRVRPGTAVERPIRPPLLRVAGHPVAVLADGSLHPLTLRASRRTARNVSADTAVTRSGAIYAVRERRLHAWRCRVSGSRRLRCYEDWTQPLGAAVTAPPVIVGERVIVGSWDTFLYAFDTDTGHLRWRRRVERRLQTQLLVSDRLVVAAIRDPAQLRAFGVRDGNRAFDLQLPEGEVLPFGAARAGGRVITASVDVLDEQPLLRAWPWPGGDQSSPRSADSSRDSMSR